MTALPTQDTMYEALVQRDAGFDGLFVVGVKTTGIFCRPTCPARKPRQENVEFMPTARDALHAGYRPCLRCRPMDMHGAPPAWIQRVLDVVDAAPADRLTDADLREQNVDPARVRRYFNEQYGMTFHAYHRARRMGLALSAVREGRDLNMVALDHGYESPSGFRDAFVRVFGRPPGSSRDMPCMKARWLDTPLGAMLAVAHDDGLCLLEFVDRRALERELEDLRRRLHCAIVPGNNTHLDRTADELTRYFDGSLREFSVPLITPGSDFQQDVWQSLREIPYGKTRSYAEMADRVGRPGAHRAVGRKRTEPDRNHRSLPSRDPV